MSVGVYDVRQNKELLLTDIQHFDCNTLPVKERLRQGAFDDVYTTDYGSPGKVQNIQHKNKM